MVFTIHQQIYIIATLLFRRFFDLLTIAKPQSCRIAIGKLNAISRICGSPRRKRNKNGRCEARAMPLLVDKQTHDSFFARIAGFDDYLEKNSTNVTTQFCKVIL